MLVKSIVVDTVIIDENTNQKFNLTLYDDNEESLLMRYDSWFKNNYTTYHFIDVSLLHSNSTQFMVDQYINVIKNILDNTDKKISFVMRGEGLQVGNLYIVNKILGILFDLGYDSDKFAYYCHANATQSNIKLLKLLHKNEPFRIKIILEDFFESNAKSNLLTEKFDFLSEINHVIENKKYVLLTYNRSPREHRIYLTAEIIKRNLLNQSIISSEVPVDFINNYDLNRRDTTFPRYGKENYTVLKNHVHLFPMKLRDFSNISTALPEDIGHYESCFIKLITETKFCHTKDNSSELLMDSYFFTEKTWKTISVKMPFILAGFVGSLKALHEMGYRTFHPFINEYYDTIENDELRLLAIMDEIDRLAKQTPIEWKTFLDNISPIVEHNFQNLKNSPSRTLIFDPNENG